MRKDLGVKPYVLPMPVLIVSAYDENIEKASPIVYDPTSHSYYTLGEKAGNAFSDGKKLIR